MSSASSPAGAGESRRQPFERVLSEARFDGLKAVLERLGTEPEVLLAAVLVANTYEELLARLGHKLVLTRQIHVQDCYSRLGSQGGIKAVLPYHDIPTQSSLPTLVNYDSSVTTTPKAAAFFDALVGELKKRLNAQP